MDPLVALRDRRGLRLGLMGGTFDPIHIGHLVTAEEALRQFFLDEIVFIPTGQPPHKTGQVASPEERYTMTCVATASHPQFWVSRLELDSPGMDYTVDTLAALREVFASDVDFFFITGADAVLDILAWKDPERVLEWCEVIAATRPGYDLSRLADVLGGLAGRDHVHVMEIPSIAVSSSMIRERLRAGGGVRYLVPEGVVTLIEKSGIYASGAHASRADAPLARGRAGEGGACG
ncbi:MAG: nicotinate-nucleotide adenylyltransferase [Thermoleophilia bacterium]